jgi:hypothetical protein
LIACIFASKNSKLFSAASINCSGVFTNYISFDLFLKINNYHDFIINKLNQRILS